MWKSLAVVTAIIGLMGLALRIATTAGERNFTRGEMPSCESKSVMNLLKGSIEGSPAGKLGGLTVAEVMEARRVQGQWTDTKQHCAAALFTNTGKHEVRFTTEWMSADKDKIWLQTEPF